MAYRDPDEDAQRGGEKELAAREAIAPLAAEGRALREGRPTHALVPAPRSFPLLPARQVRALIRRLPRGWSSDALAALRSRPTDRWLEWAALLVAASSGFVSLASTALGTVVLSVGGVCAARLYTSRFAALRREVSWLLSLPFDLHGYLELLPILREHALAFDVDVELPPEGLALLGDLVERVRDGHAVSVGAVPRGASIVFADPISPERLRRLADEALVPLHRLHPITHVGVRRAVASSHDVP